MNIVKIAKYMECMKNHAASIGGNATDGCGEFIPTTPESFNCSACGCHRNFHRKEMEGITSPTDFYHHLSAKEYVPLMIMPLRKRRLRTKFSSEQKDRMVGFAERVGWRMKGEEEGMVERFCREIGIKRRVLKVWMHNNKHHFVKKNTSGNGGDLQLQ